MIEVAWSSACHSARGHIITSVQKMLQAEDQSQNIHQYITFSCFILHAALPHRAKLLINPSEKASCDH